ncbi:class I SAM-dependent methyltransferase [Spongiimicrobium salis]|uniref:class I SAM-dependent methyltransferase n=1 Tax=Spongiimicrobium salis TaxID=1667022 RepID=UPI00374C9D0D
MAKNATSRFYNWFSSLYPLVAFFFKPQKKRLFNEINVEAPGKLLEIGIGNGSHLKAYQNHLVTGIDTSPGMLRIAHKKNKYSANLYLMKGEELKFKDNSFDYVVLSHVIAVVPDPEKILEEAYRVLKPNGKLFLLNHFTPNTILKYVDICFHPFSKFFHFKSIFYSEKLITLRQFILLNEIKFRPLSYFKLLIFSKP